MNPVGDRASPRNTPRDDHRGCATESVDASLDDPVTSAIASMQGARGAASVERALAIATLFAVPGIAPLGNTQWTESWALFALLCAGALLCWILFAQALVPLTAWLAQFGDRPRLGLALSVGIAAGCCLPRCARRRSGVGRPLTQTKAPSCPRSSIHCSVG